MQCQKCNAKFESGRTVCASCGTSIQVATTYTPVPSALNQQSAWENPLTPAEKLGRIRACLLKIKGQTEFNETLIAEWTAIFQEIAELDQELSSTESKWPGQSDEALSEDMQREIDRVNRVVDTHNKNAGRDGPHPVKN